MSINIILKLGKIYFDILTVIVKILHRASNDYKLQSLEMLWMRNYKPFKIDK